MSRLIIITGASRGIGHQIALESFKRFPSDSIFLLIARDLEKLESVRNQMCLLDPKSNNKVFIMKIDFAEVSSVDSYANLLKHDFVNYAIPPNVSSTNVKQLYIFYNHGTLFLGQVDQLGEQVAREFQINVTSVWQLMNAMLKVFPPNQIASQFHVNISSLLSVKIEKQFSLYSATRSARATLFKSLALEHGELRVINYQPGPVYTDMLKQVYDNSEAHFSGPTSFKGKFL